ncbi:MAG: hypothetical protein HDT14_09675 [Oscillibacter sp.]|nr:hypothetical protein [Oscillibacter sp.]
MSDFEEKLNAVLSNPDAMSQIMNLAQSLNLGGGPGGEGGGSENPQDSPGPPPEGGSGGGPGPGDLSGLGSLLGGIDPAMLQRLAPLIGELSGNGGGNDERMQLLYALRPFLKPERRDKVERAARAARLIRVGKKLLQSMGESYV